MVGENVKQRSSFISEWTLLMLSVNNTGSHQPMRFPLRVADSDLYKYLNSHRIGDETSETCCHPNAKGESDLFSALNELAAGGIGDKGKFACNVARISWVGARWDAFVADFWCVCC